MLTALAEEFCSELRGVLALPPEECTWWNCTTAHWAEWCTSCCVLCLLCALPNVIEETKSWVERKRFKLLRYWHVSFKRAIRYSERRRAHLKHLWLRVFFCDSWINMNSVSELPSLRHFPTNRLNTCSVDPSFLLLPTPSLPLSPSRFSPSFFSLFSSRFPPLCLTLLLLFSLFFTRLYGILFFYHILNVVVA